MVSLPAPLLVSGAVIVPSYLSLNGKPLPMVEIIPSFAAGSFPAGRINGRGATVGASDWVEFGLSRSLTGDAADRPTASNTCPFIPTVGIFSPLLVGL